MTLREKEIIKLILRGKSNKEIGDELFISERTVKNHIYNTYKKLDINSRFELIHLFNQ
ncbi:MAG: helix-turn-helix transcriptional regulator [Spirochaetes bacterium]|nr:helix-turn-helix transcriptional regulator [Spirochaetota bacterium]